MHVHYTVPCEGQGEETETHLGVVALEGGHFRDLGGGEGGKEGIGEGGEGGMTGGRED